MSMSMLFVQAPPKSNPQPSAFLPRQMPAAQNIMEEALLVGESGHTRWQLKAIYDATGDGVITWVSVEYLIRLAHGGGRLPRRQDIPHEAFLTMLQVEKQALYAVTNRWLSIAHPDPDLFHLTQLVKVLKTEKADLRDGVFLGFCKPLSGAARPH